MGFALSLFSGKPLGSSLIKKRDSKRFSQIRKIEKYFHKKRTFLQMITNKIRCIQIILGWRRHTSECVVFEVIRTISRLFMFFYDKILSIEEALKRKTNPFHPVKSFCAYKKLLPLLLFVHFFCFVTWFLLVTCFFAFKVFPEKKRK